LKTFPKLGDVVEPATERRPFAKRELMKEIEACILELETDSRAGPGRLSGLA